MLSNRGIGNEIGFYIFDYDPEYEPLVQQHIDKLICQLTSPPDELVVVEINLYKSILDILDERKVLQRAFDLEKTKGSATLAKNIAPLIRPDQIIAYINRKLQGNEQLILMTGVGASYPILRSHSILNNLHIVTRFVEFLRITYSPETLTENLEFIANALILRNGESPLERIRRYFLQ